MTTHSELTALLERVERATGPDQEIDADMVRLFISPGEAVLHRQYSIAAYDYTASLDAIVGLIERELPDRLWQVRRGIGCQAVIWSLETDYDDRPATAGYSATVPALALCAAFLRGKLAQVTE